MLNYYEIGQRIRRFRKAAGLSQEQLAEKAKISLTHMSHIETGNTKLSLPVLTELAAALDVCTDDLLFENTPRTRTTVQNKILDLLSQCTPSQSRILADILSSTKKALDYYYTE